MSETSMSEELIRIKRIATSKLPVGLSSPVYRVFYERRLYAKAWCDGKICEDRTKTVIETIKLCDDMIKTYYDLT